jgi:hypothetical protein
MHLILQGLEEEGSGDMPGGLCVPKILSVRQFFMDVNGCLPDPSAAFSCPKKRPGNPDRVHRILVVCICEYPGLLRLGGRARGLPVRADSVEDAGNTLF